jgi:ATP-dependent Lon protease
VAVAQERGLRARGQKEKEQAMTTPKTRPTIVHGETHSYPVLPLRDIVVFPHNIVPLFVGREKSIRALEEVMRNDALVMLATQKNASDDDPAPDAIYETGTLASVLQLLKLPDGTVKVLVEGLERARVEKYSDRSEFYEATAVALADSDSKSVEAEALARSVVSDFESYVKLNKKISAEVVGVVQAITDFGKLADTVASHLAVKIADRQGILETLSVTSRLEKVLGLLESEISVLQVEKRIRSRVKRQMEKTQTSRARPFPWPPSARPGPARKACRECSRAPQALVRASFPAWTPASR